MFRLCFHCKSDSLRDFVVRALFVQYECDGSGKSPQSTHIHNSNNKTIIALITPKEGLSHRQNAKNNIKRMPWAMLFSI